MDINIQYVISDFVNDFNIELYHLTIDEYQEKLYGYYLNFLEEWIASDTENNYDIELDDYLVRESFEKHLAEYLLDNYVSKLEENQITKIDELNALVSGQRTTEWYQERKKKITASECSKLIPSRSQKYKEYCNVQTLFKKLFLYTENESTNEACLHGIILEDATSNIYMTRNSVKIVEYGCIPHSSIQYLAASPDGVVRSCDDPTNLSQISKIGRMIEIKNPFSRIIDGTIKKDYALQMQLQLEVCNLDLCDFVETSIKEYHYSNLDELLNDKLDLDNITDEEISNLPNKGIPLSNYTSDKLEKGILIYFFKKSEETWKRDTNIGVHYPLDIPYDAKIIKDWISTTTKKYKEDGYRFISCYYWKLDVYSVITVKRDNDYFKTCMNPYFSHFWDEVEKCLKLTDKELVDKFPNYLEIDNTIQLNPMVNRKIRIGKNKQKIYINAKKTEPNSLGDIINNMNSINLSSITSNTSNTCKVININIANNNIPLNNLVPIITEESQRNCNMIDKSIKKTTFSRKGNPKKKIIYYFGDEEI